MSGGIDIELIGLREALVRLDKYDRKALISRFRKGARKGANLIRASIRAEAKPHKRSGRMARSVRIRSLREGGFRIGPTAPESHLVIRGTKQRQTHAGANRGRMPADPFVDRGVDRKLPDALREIRDAILDESQ